jgi:hypothetical protein
MRKSEKIYQMALRMRRKKNKFAEKILIMILKVIFNFDIQTPADIDTSVQFVHNGMGCVIHPKTIIKLIVLSIKMSQSAEIQKLLMEKKQIKGPPSLKKDALFILAHVLQAQ